ncbi:hypothetical protein L935_03885 [Helicobacter pylori PZ5086]|nr:hypothetical protein L935_03885 [Helicobacter pylori PZ5086]
MGLEKTLFFSNAFPIIGASQQVLFFDLVGFIGLVFIVI